MVRVTHAQEYKFVLSYLYQSGRRDGTHNYDTFLSAVRHFKLKDEEELENEELAAWKVRALKKCLPRGRCGHLALTCVSCPDNCLGLGKLCADELVPRL